MDQRLTLVTLGVANLDRARRFYEALGWRPATESVAGEVVFFQAGGLVLALWGRADLAADAGVAVAGPGGMTLAQNVATRAEVAPLLAAAEVAGGTVTRAAADTPWGGHTGYFADPDGHLWEIAWNPHWPLAADGSLRLPSSRG